MTITDLSRWQDPETQQQLQAAFMEAEAATAAEFHGETCSMLTVDGTRKCPLCFFGLRVKALLGIPLTPEQVRWAKVEDTRP